MEHTTIIFVATAISLYALFSKRLESTVLTPPLLFLGFGLAGHTLGLLGDSSPESSVHLVAEVTLILVLFADAARIDVRALRSELGIPARLLGIGLPLSIVVGAFVAWTVLPGLSLWEAAALAAILAPTDAALGQAVVSSPKVPLRIRQALNVESGLNDGIALPVVLLLATLAAHNQTTASHWIRFAGMQVLLGPLAGIAVGWIGAKLIEWSASRDWVNQHMLRVSGLALAVLSYVIAEAVGGNGFIAAFVGGMTLGNTSRDHCDAVYHFLEAEGQLLMLIVFLLFGGYMVPEVLEHATLRTAGYAVLSLTVIRMLPVSLALLGSGLRPWTHIFLGWFGPRGLASILFALLVMDDFTLSAHETIEQVALLTVCLSILLHGVSVLPGASRYGAFAAAHQHDCPAEMQEVTAHPTRNASK